MSSINKSTKGVYRYYNCNPHHVRTDDCVIRAIAAGTGETWEKILHDLTDWMAKTGYMIGTPECYGEYLKHRGWIRCKQVIKSNKKKVRLAELAQKFNGHVVIHAGCGHVSYLADGCVWDIWNCEDEVAGICWVPEDEVKAFEKVRKEF